MHSLYVYIVCVISVGVRSAFSYLEISFESALTNVCMFLSVVFKWMSLYSTFTPSDELGIVHL